MERLKFEECKNCRDWNGCIVNCMDTCGKPIDALKEFNAYKTLEEQGKLLKLPCAVGDKVYVIPSETNYKLNIVNDCGENNRVYEQIVNKIEITQAGYLLVTCDGMAGVVDTFYKNTWFLTREEAEAALKSRKEVEKNGQRFGQQEKYP